MKCDLCVPPKTVFATRYGLTLRLGGAELRVFSKTGEIYSAPTLVYHYVHTHHYKLPYRFVRALREGPRPPSQEYFEKLRRLDLEWQETSSPAANQPAFMFEKIEGKVRRIEVPRSIYFDES